jgi:hypothetical protein
MHPAYYNYRSLRAARTAVNEIAREFRATIASRSIAIGSPGARSPLTMTNSHVAERLRSEIPSAGQKERDRERHARYTGLECASRLMSR